MTLECINKQEIRSVEHGSRVHKSMAELYSNFGDSTTSKGKIAYFFIAHARNGHLSTSGQKSDVIIVFPDPDFPQGAGILAIPEHLRQILRFSYLHGFSEYLGQKLVLGGK